MNDASICIETQLSIVKKKVQFNLVVHNAEEFLYV